MTTLKSDAGTPRTASPRTYRLNEIGLLVAIVVLYVVLTASAAGFLTAGNQLGILRDAATIGIAAWGVTLVIIAGDIDISIGPAVAFSSVLVAKGSAEWGLGIVGAIVMTLVLGTLLGRTGGLSPSAIQRAVVHHHPRRVEHPGRPGALPDRRTARGASAERSDGRAGRQRPGRPDLGGRHAGAVRRLRLRRQVHRLRALGLRHRGQRRGRDAGGHQPQAHPRAAVRHHRSALGGHRRAASPPVSDREMAVPLRVSSSTSSPPSSSAARCSPAAAGACSARCSASCSSP